jgi:transcriptional regulator with XRE-family HTH domain
MSSRELAAKAKLSVSYINHLLAGAKEPSWDSVCKLADALGVYTDAFRANNGKKS